MYPWHSIFCLVISFLASCVDVHTIQLTSLCQDLFQFLGALGRSSFSVVVIGSISRYFDVVIDFLDQYFDVFIGSLGRYFDVVPRFCRTSVSYGSHSNLSDLSPLPQWKTSEHTFVKSADCFVVCSTDRWNDLERFLPNCQYSPSGSSCFSVRDIVCDRLRLSGRHFCPRRTRLLCAWRGRQYLLLRRAIDPLLTLTVLLILSFSVVTFLA